VLFVFTDFVEYLVENGYGLAIVLLGAQDAERNKPPEPSIGGLAFTH
jgi:hypothetical protein